MSKQNLREILQEISAHELASKKFIAVSTAAQNLAVCRMTILNRIKRGTYPARVFQGSLILVDISKETN